VDVVVIVVGASSMGGASMVGVRLQVVEEVLLASSTLGSMNFHNPSCINIMHTL